MHGAEHSPTFINDPYIHEVYAASIKLRCLIRQGTSRTNGHSELGTGFMAAIMTIDSWGT